MHTDRVKRNECQRRSQRVQRLKRKERAFELLGGKCAHCGYNENIVALQIDHIEPQLAPRDKSWGSFRIINGLARGTMTIDGLQLLCANCHAIKTYEDRVKFACYKE